MLQGFRQEREYQIAKKLLESIECRSLVGKSIAIKSAENYRLLRSQGITVRKTVVMQSGWCLRTGSPDSTITHIASLPGKPIDVMIATFCIEHQLPLLHADKDFDVMKSLGLKTL